MSARKTKCGQKILYDRTNGLVQSWCEYPVFAGITYNRVNVRPGRLDSTLTWHKRVLLIRTVNSFPNTRQRIPFFGI